MSEIKLSILIPTYNRAELLESCLLHLQRISSNKSIEIIVSDNCSEDNTVYVCNKLISKIENLKCFRHEYNIGYDKNVDFSIQNSQGEYFWILGDSYEIVEGEFLNIYHEIESGIFDAIILNGLNRVKNFRTTTFYSVNEIVDNIGWHLTLLNSVIYRSEVFKIGFLPKYIGTDFYHFGLFFEVLSKMQKPKIKWLENNNINHSPVLANNSMLRRGGWLNCYFKVFAFNWYNLVLKLPSSIPIHLKLKCVKDHGRNTFVFDLVRIAKFRAHGQLRIDDYRENRRALRECTELPLILYDIVIYLPNSFWKIILFLNSVLSGIFIRRKFD